MPLGKQASKPLPVKDVLLGKPGGCTLLGKPGGGCELEKSTGSVCSLPPLPPVVVAAVAAAAPTGAAAAVPPDSRADVTRPWAVLEPVVGEANPPEPVVMEVKAPLPLLTLKIWNIILYVCI